MRRVTFDRIKRRAAVALQPAQSEAKAAVQGPLRAVKDVVDEAVNSADASWKGLPVVPKVLTAPMVAAMDAARGVVDTIFTEKVVLPDGPPAKRRKLNTAMALAVEPNPGPRSKKTAKRQSKKKRRTKKGTRKRTRKPQRQAKLSRGATRVIRQHNDGQGYFTGEDLVLNATILAGDDTPGPGDIVYQTDISPVSTTPGAAVASGIGGISLNYEAAKWECFDCDVAFKIEPVGNRNVIGNWTAGIEMDPTDVLPGGDEAIQRLTLQGGKTHTWADGGTVGFSLRNRMRAQKLYYCSRPTGSSPDSVRMTAKGRFYLVVNQHPATFITTDTGTAVSVPIQVKCLYRFRFYNRTLEPTGAPFSPGAQPALSYGGMVGTQADPFGLYQWASGLNTPATKEALGLSGLIVGVVSSAIYLAFPAGTFFEGVNYLLLSGNFVQTSPNFSTSALGGATSVRKTVLYSGTTCSYNETLALSSSLSAVNFSQAWRWDGSKWNQLSGGWSGNSYGYFGFSSSSANNTSSVNFAMAAFIVQSLTRQDQLRCRGGPATLEYHALQAWDQITPFTQHLADFRALRAKVASPPKLLRYPALAVPRPATPSLDGPDEPLPDVLAGLQALDEKELKGAGAQSKARPRVQTRDVGGQSATLVRHALRSAPHSEDHRIERLLQMLARVPEDLDPRAVPDIEDIVVVPPSTPVKGKAIEPTL